LIFFFLVGVGGVDGTTGRIFCSLPGRHIYILVWIYEIEFTLD
jgi:hypothetical protein